MTTQTKTILKLSLLAVALVALIVFPLIVPNKGTLSIIILIFLYACLASSWNIIGGYTGQTNLGHAAFFGAGSLVARILWIAGWPFWISFLLGGLVAMGLAALIGLPAFRLKGVYFAIGTLALAQILYVTVGLVFPQMSYHPEITNYQILPRYWLFLALAVITVAAAYFLTRSKMGLGMKAVKEDEDAAESLGVSAMKHKMVALLVSAFLAGLAGGAFAYYHISYYLDMPFSPGWTLDPVTIAYVGGAGTIEGPIIGSIFYVIMRELLIKNVGEYHMLIFGLLFILVILFVPGGFMDLWKLVKRSITDKFVNRTAKTREKK
jgi:branched-chain amino acid transport system permease protein